MSTAAIRFITAIAVAMALPGHAWSKGAPIALSCQSAARVASDARAVVLNEMSAAGIKYGPGDWVWMKGMLDQGGLPSAPITKLSQMAKASFEAEASLLKAGYLISALMIHDGSKSISDYASSRNSTSIHRFMVIAVQPTSHPSTDPSDASHDHGDAAINQKMALISKRLAVVKAGLGPFYSETAAKYFIRGHAYDDPIAVRASTKLLCSDGLNPNQLSAIVQGANYVVHGVMPKAPQKTAATK